MLNFNDIHQKTVINCELLTAAEIEGALQSFAAVRKVDLITTAILLARSQNTLGKKDWLAWAENVSGLTRSECYHRAKVGHLMIACFDKKVLYRNLLKLSGDKLLALSRLPLEILEGFLSVTPVADMPIDQVRNAVTCQLCHLNHQGRGSLPDCEHCLLNSAKRQCCDWRDCLARFSGPGYLAYCDPPYVSGCRKAGGYAHELQDGDHEELITTLMSYDGAVVLSGCNSSLYAPLQASGWDMQTVDVVCTAAGRTRHSGLQGTGNVKAKQSRIECIWRNPEAMRRIKEQS